MEPVFSEDLISCRECGKRFQRLGRFAPRVCRPCRFWKKVNKEGSVPLHRPHLGFCWEWTGAKYSNGYGSFRCGTRLGIAHRVAWELVKGAIPQGLLILHRCDNPPCVNPAHLFVGTYADNTNDRNSKGRANPNPPVGERQPLSKLTAEDVLKIRKLHSEGVKQRELARAFKVAPQTISALITRRTWKHV